MKAKNINSFIQLKKIISGEMSIDEMEETQTQIEKPLFQTYNVRTLADGTKELKNIETGKVISEIEYLAKEKRSTQKSFDLFI